MKNNLFLRFLAFFIVAVTLYWNTFSLGYFSDDFVFIHKFESQGLSGLTSNFGHPFFMPITFIFQWLEGCISTSYTFVKIINLLLLSGSGYLIWRITTRIMGQRTLNSATSLFAGLLFIALPYQHEAVNWYSCQAYLLATVFALLSIHLFLLADQKNRQFQWALFFLFLSLLCKEIALTLPLIFVAVRWLMPRENRVPFLHLVLGSTLVWIVYFALRYWSLGDLIGGYGSATHLNGEPFIIIDGLIAYFAKFILLYRYLPHDLLGYLIFVAPVLTLGLSLYFRKQFTRENLKLVGTLASLFLLAVIPVINLETSFLGDLQGDRYGYFPSVFFCLALAVGLSVLWKKLIFVIGSLAFVVYSMATVQGHRTWNTAASLRDHFITSVNNLPDDQPSIVFNLPDNYKGVYLFRRGVDEAFGRKRLSTVQFLYSESFSKPILELDYRENDSVMRILSFEHVIPLDDTGIIYKSWGSGRAQELQVNLDRIEKNTQLYYFTGKKLMDITPAQR